MERIRHDLPRDMQPPEPAVRDAVLHNVRDRWDRYERGRDFYLDSHVDETTAPFDLPIGAALHGIDIDTVAGAEAKDQYLDPGKIGREIIAWSTLGDANLVDDPLGRLIQREIANMYKDYGEVGYPYKHEVKIARMAKGAENWAVLSLRSIIAEVRRERHLRSQITKRAVGLIHLDNQCVGASLDESVRKLAAFGDGSYRMSDEEAAPHKNRILDSIMNPTNAAITPVISSLYQTREGE